jgi:energy-coupling factor transporter transmembrane protein EcfT
MVWPDVLFVFILALLFTLVLAGPSRWRYSRGGGVWPAAGFLFLLFVAVIWVAGVWSMPCGPALWNVSWLPFVLAGFLLALIILAISAAIGPPRARTEAGVAAVFGVFFSVLMPESIAAIAIAFATETPPQPGPPGAALLAASPAGATGHAGRVAGRVPPP